MSLHPFAASGIIQADGAELHPVDKPGMPGLASLDVLRGLAVLGLLMAGIWGFGGFTPNQQIFYRSNPHGGNYALLTAVSVMFEGKMTALLAMVFGAGIVVFLTKQHPARITASDAYIRRQLWLLLFGLFIAFIFLWPSDILYPFAVVGIILFGMWRFSGRGLFLISMFFLLVFVGKQFWNYQDDKKDYKKYLAVTVVEKRIKADSTTRAKRDSTLKAKDSVLYKNDLAKNKIKDSLAKRKDTLTKKQADEKGKWEGIVKSTKYDSAKTASLNKSMRNVSYSKVWNDVFKQSQDKESIWLYQIGLWEFGSMMLLGMALFKFGFFDSRLTAGKHFLFALLLIAGGMGFAWYRLHYNNIRLADYEGFVKGHATPYDLWLPLENMLTAAGYASLLLGLLQLRALTWLWHALASVGTMALSNYFLQCLVCSLFFYGYGFGYFGKLEQAELYFMVLELALIQVVFSVLWQRYFIMGPLEWLWSCLIYREWLPLKKPAAFIEETSTVPAT